MATTSDQTHQNKSKSPDRDQNDPDDQSTYASLATEQILRYDEQDRMNIDSSNIITRLRTDLTHERQLRKDTESKLKESQNNYEEIRKKSKDMNLQLQRIHTEVIANRHEKTHLESRNQDLFSDINKFSEKIDFYKNQTNQFKMNYDREYKIRIQNEDKISDLNKQLEHLNNQLDNNHVEKRSRLIAEEQYRSAILERDRNIKRQANEIDQLTNRLAESSKMTDGIRKDKSTKDEEIMKLKNEVRKKQIASDKAIEDYLEVKKENNKNISELAAAKRELKSIEVELKQSTDQYKKKIEELDKKETEKGLLLNTMSELKAKQNHKDSKSEERILLQGGPG